MAFEPRIWVDEFTGVSAVHARLAPNQSVKCQGCGKQLGPGSIAIHLFPRLTPPPNGLKQTFGNRIFCSKRCLLAWLREDPKATYPGLIEWVKSLPIDP